MSGASERLEGMVRYRQDIDIGQYDYALSTNVLSTCSLPLLTAPPHRPPAYVLLPTRHESMNIPK